MARKRGNRWQSDCIVGGQRVRPAFDTEQEAVAFEANAAHVLALGEASVGVILPDYCEKIWSKEKSYRDAKSITKDLVRRIGPKTYVFQIDEMLIEEMKETMEEEGLAPQTINNKLTRLSKMLRRALKRKLITAMPPIELYPQRAGHLRYLTETEEVALLACFEDEYLHFCKFLLYTGCRYSEATKLKWVDINESYIAFMDTKNGESRAVPFTEQTASVIEWAKLTRHNQAGPFSCMTYTKFRKRWVKARDAAGFADDVLMTPHVLRHTCASRLVQRGVDLKRVMVWLGHKDYKTTLRYAKLSPHHLQSAARILEQQTYHLGVDAA